MGPRHQTTRLDPPIRIGVSSCLLGEAVRYDGGHKLDRYLTDTLGEFFEFVPVCPEVELGLGMPREAMRLESASDGPRMVTTSSREDLTSAMAQFAARRLDKLAAERLSGYILKSSSPSCGLFRVKVYGRQGSPSRTGRGIFARALAERFPSMPLEEEGRLCDSRLRENWIERVFAYHRLESFWAGRWTVRSLIEFHTAHKLAILSHSPVAYRELGRLVGSAADTPRAVLRRLYHERFMSALAIPATRGRHTNVLQHMTGYLREKLDGASREELIGLIEDYRKGEAPLIVPLTLIRHHARVLGIGYLSGQVYLNPHPKELALRNRV